MSGRGNCYDNAVAESFFHSLKTELVHHERYTTPPHLLLVALLAGGSAGAFHLWYRHLDDQFFPKRFAVVEDGFLYRSGQISPRLVRRTLEENGIDVVVWLAHSDERRADHRAEREAIEAPRIEQINLHLRGD